MQKVLPDRRITALDGVRGLAIILVVLTHIESSYFQPYLTPFVTRIFFSSGITGVSLLFILSGFFMALMYPDPKDRIAFIQKRYTRIFPLFTMMCLMTVILRMTSLPWYVQVATFAGLGLLFHRGWLIVQQQFSLHQKRLLFLGFLFLQIAVGSFYFFWLMRQPSIVFTQVWSPFAREVMTGLVNGTLTLPLGNYIPMIDGVYWSLAAEVLFYVLYATILVPIIALLRGIARIEKIFLLILLIPFFAGLNVLSARLFGFGLLQPEFGYYFVTGIVLGYLYRYKTALFQSIHRFFPGILGVLPVGFFFLSVASKDQSFQYVERWVDPWLHILWALPLTVALAVALDPKMLIARVLRSRILVFFGTISYSLYLSHSMVIHLVDKFVPVTSVQSNTVNLGVSLLLSTLASTFLYYFLEKPYFHKQTPALRHPEQSLSPFFRNPLAIITTFIVLFCASVVVAYQSNFNFFSTIVPVNNLTMIEPKRMTEGKVDMATSPKVSFEFVSPNDEFGVLTLKLLHESRDGVEGKKQRLIFSIKESGKNEWYATNSYALEEIGATDGDPYGFPVISDSKGKKFVVEFALQELDSPASARLDLTTVRGVYTVNKKALIQDPVKLTAYTFSRVQNIFSYADSKKVLLYVTPTLVFFCVVVFVYRKQWSRT